MSESTTFAALFLLVLAHYVANSGMQAGQVAYEKGRTRGDSNGPRGLVAHACIHGATVTAALMAVGLPWLVPAMTTIVVYGVIGSFKSARTDWVLHAGRIIFVWLLALNL